MWDNARLVKQVLYCAMYTALALMLSFVEAVLPVTLWLPLPGFKLGLANLAIMDSAFRMGIGAALTVSAARILLMGLLFGNAVSLLFSLCGGLVVLIVLFFCTRLRRVFSFVGISVLCALSHSLGQLFCAVWIMGNGSAVLTTYAPFLAAASLIFGTVNGVLLHITAPRLPKIK